MAQRYFRPNYGSNQYDRANEVVWKMDGLYLQQLLEYLHATHLALIAAKKDPDADTVREAWAVVEELFGAAAVYLPKDYREAARAEVYAAIKDVYKNRPRKAVFRLLRARDLIVRGLAARRVIGATKERGEDMKTQAIKLLDSAIEKRFEKELEKVGEKADGAPST